MASLWKCDHCGLNNKNKEAKCIACFNTKSSKPHKDPKPNKYSKPNKDSKPKDPASGNWKCTHCHFVNDKSAAKCHNCYAGHHELCTKWKFADRLLTADRYFKRVNNNPMDLQVPQMNFIQVFPGAKETKNDDDEEEDKEEEPANQADMREQWPKYMDFKPLPMPEIPKKYKKTDKAGKIYQSYVGITDAEKTKMEAIVTKAVTGSWDKDALNSRWMKAADNGEAEFHSEALALHRWPLTDRHVDATLLIISTYSPCANCQSSHPYSLNRLKKLCNEKYYKKCIYLFGKPWDKESAFIDSPATDPKWTQNLPLFEFGECGKQLAKVQDKHYEEVIKVSQAAIEYDDPQQARASYYHDLR